MRNFYLLAAVLFSSVIAHAQGTTGYSGTGGNINVDNYQIWWQVNPDSVVGSTHIPNIKGIVTVKFRTTVANVTNISLDLRAGYHTIDNITWNHGTLVPSWSGNTFSFPVNIPLKGTRDSVTITYHGQPPSAAGSTSGFNFLNTANGYSVNTLSESYEDRDWWPCKADMQDKADTIDITVNVPWKRKLPSLTDTFWVASNGTLIDSTINTIDSSRTFKYINRYPMPTYLVCLGIARYNRYYRGTVPIGGFNVPIVYYLLAGKSSYTSILSAMDKATECVAAFSTKYGNYGFIDPARGGKHGFYEGLTGASGMEHQTFSAIATGALTSTNTLIHELQHQWFGDKVTFSTWNDLWLAEGFAEYSPGLARELISGLSGTAASYRSGIRSSALSETAPVYIPNSGIANSDLIWGGSGSVAYGSSVYDRGAMVVSMMRTLAGDTKFFNMMTSYQTRPALQYGSASIDTVKKLFHDSLGISMDPFFTDNVVGTGYPNNTVGYQYFGAGQKSVALNLQAQTRTNAGSASFISQPVVVHLKGASAGNDTTIVFYAWSTSSLSKAGNGVAAPSGNSLTYTLSFKPTSIFYDDSSRTMSAPLNGDVSTPGLVAISIVDLKILDFSAKQHSGYNDATLLLDDNSINANVILERSSDGINFDEQGMMILQASSPSSKKYLFNDMSPLKGDNYYRAKYKNADGVFIYSKIVKLGSTKLNAYIIINNPVHDLLQVRTAASGGKDILFNVFDAAGKLILNRLVKNAGSVTGISLPKLAVGIYVLKIAAANDEAQNLKFMVQ